MSYGANSIVQKIQGLDGDAMAQAVLLALQAAALKTIPHAGHGDIPVMLKPEGFEIQDLSPMIPQHPDRIRACVTMESVNSFTEYVNRFKLDESVIFADVLEPPYEFTAILDYHKPATGAAWGTHIVKLVLTQTDEWKTWKGADKNAMDQVDFAHFIEDNVNDIRTPDGATMLEMALAFEASQDASFSGKLNLQNGDVALVADQSTTAQAVGKDGKITIPGEFTLRIAPFRGMPQSDVQARFKYNLCRGRLSLGYQLIRPKQLLDHVVGQSQDVIAAETGLPVFAGSYADQTKKA